MELVIISAIFIALLTTSIAAVFSFQYDMKKATNSYDYYTKRNYRNTAITVLIIIILIILLSSYIIN